MVVPLVVISSILKSAGNGWMAADASVERRRKIARMHARIAEGSGPAQADSGAVRRLGTRGAPDKRAKSPFGPAMPIGPSDTRRADLALRLERQLMSCSFRGGGAGCSTVKLPVPVEAWPFRFAARFCFRQPLPNVPHQ